MSWNERKKERRTSSSSNSTLRTGCALWRLDREMVKPPCACATHQRTSSSRPPCAVVSATGAAASLSSRCPFARTHSYSTSTRCRSARPLPIDVPLSYSTGAQTANCSQRAFLTRHFRRLPQHQHTCQCLHTQNTSIRAYAYHSDTSRSIRIRSVSTQVLWTVTTELELFR